MFTKNLEKFEKIPIKIRKKAYLVLPPDISYLLQESYLEGEEQQINKRSYKVRLTQEDWNMFFALCDYISSRSDMYRYTDEDEDLSVRLSLGHGDLIISHERAITLIEQLRLLV